MRKFIHMLGLGLTVVLASCGTRPGPAPLAQAPQPQPVLTGQMVSAEGTTSRAITLEVIARYPHDASAFTEGLQLVGGKLYESTGLRGQSSVRTAELATGRTLQSRAPTDAQAFGEGLTVLNGTAYQLTYTEGKAFKYDAATLTSTGEFSYSGQGWGLTNDGQSLIMSDGSSRLTWRDPETFAVRRQVNVTANGVAVRGLNELEYIGGKIYANVFPTNRMVVIDPLSGAVNLWFDLTPLAQNAGALAQSQDNVTNGIAYNPERQTLLLTGKRWPYVYEVALSGTVTPTPTPAPAPAPAPTPVPTPGPVTTPPVTGVYKLVNRRSGLALTAPALRGQQLVQQPYAASANQQWLLTKTSVGYSVVNRATGQAMDVSGGSLSNGAPIIQWPPTGATNQLWQVTPTDSGFVRLTSVKSGKAATIRNSSLSSGAGIIQLSFGTTQSDQWQISAP